ncbi:hypothetical protein Q73A0000_09650 [Kaistella flava (ex Peng et al. 2021)]|uniref:DUF5675 domain-containing protein n=1 Tax=Kaistella flava (ex Peng et al. 2021) TaxID=2038776 RepID=A0A7M2Y8N1_9FLAO|nr:DUF5675 family protein [Kaistella flava (ex Peng et al. 2021)]QOW10618.1 hypothetical protein Q73A0000_09650 [Kaistella flava (ex Peng et al. 2021)]
MELQLIRTSHPTGVNGVLLLDGVELCKTIELPWLENRPRISCIPVGKYRLRKRCSVKFNWHFELMDVPGRSAILIHPANHAALELKGCIAPVLQHTGEGKGSSSRIALERLKDRLYPLLDKGNIIYLTIK